ncbi:hypothetical protein GW813_13565, partial [bacterium]|nr:hypothetical protein [bacterium]
MLVWLDGHLSGFVTRFVPDLGSRISYGTTGLSPAVSEFPGIFPGSLQTFFGTLLRPLAWLMGVPWADAARVG